MRVLMHPTEGEKREWSRCAQALYAADRNDDGHKLSGAAAMPRGASMELSQFDDVVGIYRGWLTGY